MHLKFQHKENQSFNSLDKNLQIKLTELNKFFQIEDHPESDRIQNKDL